MFFKFFLDGFMENVIRLRMRMMQRSVLKKDMLVYYVVLVEQLHHIYLIALKSNQEIHHVIIVQMVQGAE